MIRRRTDDGPSRNVSPLISMLVRYPEIGTVKYDPRQLTIRFTLLLTGSLAESEFDHLRRLLIDSLEVYHMFDQKPPVLVEVSMESYGELTSISLTRDVTTMTPAEIWTVVEVFRERFPERLVAEPMEGVGEEELMAQDEIIEEILGEIRGGRGGRDLIAIREDGRVMVFQK